jgi:UPF0755 protein
MFFRIKPKISFKHWLKLGLIIFLITLVVGLFISWQFVARVGSGSKAIPFSIMTGESVKIIGAKLKKENLIRSQYWFEVWVWLARKEQKFITGQYYLPQNVNIINLVNLLTGGTKPSNEVTLRFIEGWTAKQMGEYLVQNGIFKTNDFDKIVNSPRSFGVVSSELESGVLKNMPPIASLEGYLFPDTYRQYRDSEPVDLIVKMLRNFGKKFLPNWQKDLSKRGYTTHQAVILASIVEREVPNYEDRALVADIFWRRIEAGRGLEADSTINYITGKKTPSVSAKDLAISSPYNTYRYRGLPPGPISNPGESALKAVIFPTANQYWYFLTTPTGQVIYSRTFEEHKKAKLQYLK